MKKQDKSARDKKESVFKRIRTMISSAKDIADFDHEFDELDKKVKKKLNRGIRKSNTDPV